MNPIVWTPQTPEASHMWQFMRYIEGKYRLKLDNYQALHHWSIQQPELFWPDLCHYFQITFDQPPQQIIMYGQTMRDTQWFIDAKLNFAQQLLARGQDNQIAIISIHEQGQRQTFTYHELKQHVAQCAAGLKQAGVQTGDRVAAVMQNIAQTIIAMLATASIGAIWSSCSLDFGTAIIIDRLSQIEPKILFACEDQIYHGKTQNTLSKIKQISSKIPSLTQIVIYSEHNSNPNLSIFANGITWENFLQPTDTLTFTSLPFAHPLYILFSSGTTGKPKCIVHGAGGTLLQHIKEHGLHTDIHAHDNMCFYTTCGWMMWNWMVSILALGATLTLYEGSPAFPNTRRLFQLIEQENITILGTSAKFILTVEQAGVVPRKDCDLSSLRCILSTGSPLLPQNYDFVYQNIKPSVQLSSISGGTDIVSCFALGNPILPVRRGELQCIGLGMRVEVFDEQGHAIRNTCGELVCTQPFPCMPIEFWRDQDCTLYQKTYFEYFPGIWRHGDFAKITANEGVIIYGRSDTVLNPGGVRIGTSEIYRQIATMPEILESIAIGQNWQDDIRVVLFIKLRDGVELTDLLRTEICRVLRTNTSLRHVPAKILQVPDIPKTMNGKIVEIAVRQIVNHQPLSHLESLANPESLRYFEDRLELQ